MQNVIRQVFRCTGLLLLLGALSLAQTGASQSASDRIAPSVTPVSSAPGGADVASQPSGGSAAAMSSNTSVTPPASTPNPEMLIGPGDLLEVSVFGAPDYLKQVRVSRDGEVTLPLAGAMKIGGMTIAQAEAAIAKKLSDGGYFVDPRVSVLEKEFATQGISVFGEVQKPGIYPLPGSRSVYDALSAAGGTTARAGTLVSITHRNDPMNPQNVVMSYDGKNSGQANIPVYPGDTVMVSKAGVVYVTGDVKTPGGFVMDNNSHMTVLQAIALAQGTTPNAKLDSTVLIRNSGQPKPEEIPVPLKAILSAKAPDMQLRPNDIVFIPNSAAKTAGKRSVEAIVQAATGMAIFAR